MLEAIDSGLDIARGIAALPTRLPSPLITFLEALGGWLSRPLTMLGGFLGYGIWVILAAKLLGGKGRLQEFLGVAALSSAPYLLLVLERVPCVGPLLRIVAWIWGTIIWIVATAVTHGWALPRTADAEGAEGTEGTEGVEEALEEVATVDYEVEWGKPILAVILPALVAGVLALIAAIGASALIAGFLRSAQS
jgi:hypothetical protein